MKNPFQTSGAKLIQGALATFHAAEAALKKGVELVEQEDAVVAQEIAAARAKFEEFQRLRSEVQADLRLFKSRAQAALRGLEKLLNG